MLEIDESIQQDEPDSITSLRTPDLILRTPQRKDWAKLAVLANDPKIIKNLPEMSFPFAEDKTAQASHLGGDQNNLPKDQYFAILNEQKTTMGAISCQHEAGGDSTDLSLWLAQAYWGRGYGTQACQALVDLMFLQHDIATIHATARVSSMASKRLLEKCGFQYCGTGMIRSAYYRGMIPIDRFKLERRIWQALRDWNHITPNKGAA